MSLHESPEYDTQTDRFYGRATFPGHDGTAPKAVVFMVAGISTRWKETVGNFVTLSSLEGAVFGPLIKEIIQCAENIRLHVKSITSDMCSSNLAMWR